MPFQRCPRCCDHTYDVLSTHDYCVSCNYCSEFSVYFRPASRLPRRQRSELAQSSLWRSVT